MGNAPKEIREVGIDDFPVSAKQQLFDLDRRLLGIPPLPVGVLFGWKVGFKDRFQHQRCRRHADPIPHTRDAQRSVLPCPFGYTPPCESPWRKSPLSERTPNFTCPPRSQIHPNTKKLAP